ncbi:MAG: hypothetical protein LBV75_00100 [Paludibacter sp.]|jgi:hypothetical protein|nr:hypothetical protein [Paludibacter sp.]
MKCHYLTIIALLFCLFATNAQNEYREWETVPSEYVNFDISKYFTPDIVRNQMAIDFNLNSDYSHKNSDYEAYTYRGTSTDYNFVGNIASNFSRYVNTRKKITDFIINLSWDKNYTSHKYTEISPSNNKDRANIISADNYVLGLKYATKRYFPNLFFLIYDVSGNVSSGFTQNTTKEQAFEKNQKLNKFVFNFTPSLGIGYGRMENVEDARQAVYIANALSKKHILARNLSNEELLELSQQISTIKNKRFLDARLHLTDEISTVDSFFVKKDLLSNAGAAYFTTLYDMWQYGALFSRKAGYEISFITHPRYTYQYLHNIPELEGVVNNLNQTILENGLVFNYEKPVKLNWQHSVEVGGFANNSKYLSAWTSYSLGYYPNTRTNIQAKVWQQIRNQVDKYSDYSNYMAGLNVSVNYYFSPYLKIAGSCNLDYEHYWNKNNGAQNVDNNYLNTYTIQLIYSIF